MSSQQSGRASPQPKTANPVNWVRRCLRFVSIYAMLPYMAIVGIFGMAQRSLIYGPTRTAALPAKSVRDPGANVEDVEIPVDPDVTLHGWLYHSSERVDESRKFLVVYFGGNGGCRADRVNDCLDFARLGFEVILFDYRGYGDNKGSPSEATIAADASRIWKFAHDELHYPSRRIVIFGESLGGAVATRLAAERSVTQDPPAALILNSTFSSLVETAEWHYPFLPAWLLLVDRFPSIKRIPSVTCPILQFHGTADEIVPFEHGLRLFDAAPQQSANGIEKQFIKIEGGTHNAISMAQMQTSINKLLDRIE